MHNLASTYGQRPSTYLGLDPLSWHAYQFDLCCLQMGNYLEGKLKEVDQKGKPKYSIHQLLGDEAKSDDNKDFASVSTLAAPKKMVIPDSGIW